MANNDIDVGFLIKDAFKSVVDDPGYFALFLLPLIVYIVAMVHLWFIIGDIFSLSQNLQNTEMITNLLRNNISFIIAIIIFYGIIGIIFYAVAMAGLIKKVDVQKINHR